MTFHLNHVHPRPSELHQCQLTPVPRQYAAHQTVWLDFLMVLIQVGKNHLDFLHFRNLKKILNLKTVFEFDGIYQGSVQYLFQSSCGWCTSSMQNFLFKKKRIYPEINHMGKYCN